MAIRQITIVGTGLIGGSLGLALKKHGFGGRIVGFDRAAVVRRAEDIGAVDAAFDNLRESVQGSDLIILATPVGAILDAIETIGPLLPKHVVFTDVGSTKHEIVERARAVFGDAAQSRFLAGHPMAGKEHGGLDHADPDLFQGAVWLFVPIPGQGLAGRDGSSAPAHPVILEWIDWVQRIGAHVMTLDAARHDRLCAWISHVPQLVSTALAASLEEEFAGDPDIQAIGGRALREMTRIASSPYSMWRDVAFTNTVNIADALLKLEQRLAHIRENLRTRQLQDEFELGNKFRHDS